MKLQRYDIYESNEFSDEYRPADNGDVCLAEDVAKLEELNEKMLNALIRIMEWNGIYDTAIAHANGLEKHALVDYFIEVGDIIRSAVSDAKQSQ